MAACSDCFSYYEHCVREKCAHKDLFPMNGSQAAGTVGTFVGYMLCAAGGIGGGPVTLPILVLLYNFRVGGAAPLANFLICAGLLFRYILNSRRRHPVIPNRIRVDYTTVQLALPPAFLGTNVGVILNSTLAPIVNLVLVVAIFIASATITLKKGITLFKTESKIKREQKTNAVQDEPHNHSQLYQEESLSNKRNEPLNSPEAEQLIKSENSHCQC